MTDVPNMENLRHGFGPNTFVGFDTSNRRDYAQATNTSVHPGYDQHRAPPQVLPRVVHQNGPLALKKNKKKNKKSIKTLM